MTTIASRYVPTYRKNEIPKPKPRASLAALSWAAERANQTYGQFTQRLTSEQEQMIQEEFEQYRRQRKQELENRSRKQPQASVIVATEEDALSTSKEEDAVIVSKDVTASEMSATAEEDAPLAPIEATTPEMVETGAAEPIIEGTKETLSDGIKQLSKEPNEGTFSRLLLQYGSDALRVAAEEELIKIRRRHGATNKLLRVMEWL